MRPARTAADTLAVQSTDRKPSAIQSTSSMQNALYGCAEGLRCAMLDILWVGTNLVATVDLLHSHKLPHLHVVAFVYLR
jgi:hypothetical protein